MPSVDVGVVYRRGERFLLAIGRRLLVGGSEGELRTTQPRASDRSVKSVSVKQLCRRWGVGLADFDALTREHMPRPEPERRVGRAPRRPQAEREHLWSAIRTHRLRTG